jgi:hypothetical protein
VPVRAPYITSKTVTDMEGMYRFMSEKAESFVPPMPRSPGEMEEHPMDEIATTFGMDGEVYQIVRDYANANVLENPLLMKAYRDYIMAAKLCMDGGELVEAGRRAAERRGRHQSRVRKYEAEMAARQARINEREENVRLAAANSHHRWLKLVNSIDACRNKDPYLHTMSPYDQAVFTSLESDNLCKIVNGKVTKLDLEALSAMDQRRVEVFLNQLRTNFEWYGLHIDPKRKKDEAPF